MNDKSKQRCHELKLAENQHANRQIEMRKECEEAKKSKRIIVN